MQGLQPGRELPRRSRRRNGSVMAAQLKKRGFTNFPNIRGGEWTSRTAIDQPWRLGLSATG